MTPRPDARRRGHITTDRWTAAEWATVEHLTAAERRAAVLGYREAVASWQAAADRSLINACRAEWAHRLVGDLGEIFATDGADSRRAIRQLEAEPRQRDALVARASETEAASRAASARIAQLVEERDALRAQVEAMRERAAILWPAGEVSS